jgi:hypothetical protein
MLFISFLFAIGSWHNVDGLLRLILQALRARRANLFAFHGRQKSSNVSISTLVVKYFNDLQFSCLQFILKTARKTIEKKIIFLFLILDFRFCSSIFRSSIMRIGSLIGSTYGGWALSGSVEKTPPHKIIFNFSVVRSISIFCQLMLIVFWGQVTNVSHLKSIVFFISDDCLWFHFIKKNCEILTISKSKTILMPIWQIGIKQIANSIFYIINQIYVGSCIFQLVCLFNFIVLYHFKAKFCKEIII